jgi:hypothetical protein
MKKIQPIADATTPAPTLSTQLMSIFASERTALALIVLNAILLLFVLRRVRRAFLAATSGATAISTKPSIAVTPAERSKYLKLCETLVAEAEAATRADSGIAWVPRGSERGARVFAYTDPKNPVIKIKGVVELDVPDISLLVKHFVSSKPRHSPASRRPSRPLLSAC